MKRLHAFLTALCCAIPFSYAHAQGIGDFVDAANYAIDGTVGGNFVGGGSDQKLAQTVTVDAGGTLEGVFLAMSCGSASTSKVHVEIHDVVGGMPGPNVLAQRAVAPTELDAPSTVAQPFHFTYVKIPGALALAAGQQIAIVVYRPKGDDCAMGQSTVSSNYPGGQGFFDARPNPPGWVPFSAFSGTPDDLPFQLVLS
jgi:hypothetical protein